jgi:hypothetical protein
VVLEADPVVALAGQAVDAAGQGVGLVVQALKSPQRKCCRSISGAHHDK